MKDPAVLFYSQDFITGTLLFTYEQRGKYITLLCIQQQNGKLTEKDMIKVCGAKDEDIWSKFETDGEYYWNKRMSIEKERRHKYTESRINNLKNPHMEAHMDTHMEIRNKKYEIGNKKEEINTINVPFENFWNLYDKKIDRKKCEPKWLRLTDAERTDCINKLPAYIQATPDKKFRRDPETYLNNKSWENEIISPTPVKVETPKTYEEMLKLTENNPELWQHYKAVKKDGERKAIFYPITK